jgi:hypothetical protein
MFASCFSISSRGVMTLPAASTEPATTTPWGFDLINELRKGPSP